jgi:hypothetical protein
MLVITILFSTSDLQKHNAGKSTNECFVTAINGQYFTVMLNLLQNLGIYNSIHFPIQTNIIQFPLSYEKKK